MLVLAIDTASHSGSVALFEDERIIGARHFDTGLEHSRRLFVEIDEALSRSDRQAAALEGVAVSIGPGSYTGLRISLSAAKGLCLASGAALVTVSTLEAMAAGLPYCAHTVCAAVGVRSGEVCWALYDTSDGEPRQLSAPRLDAVQEAFERMPRGPLVLCGDGAVAFDDVVRDVPDCRRAPAPIGKPLACYVGHLAGARFRAGDTADIDAAEPEYLRTPTYKTLLEQRSGRARG